MQTALAAQAIRIEVVPSSEGGMIVLPAYMLQLSKRFLNASRTKMEGRADNLKIETRHGNRKYRVWHARPEVENLVTIEQSIEGCDSWIVAHRYQTR